MKTFSDSEVRTHLLRLKEKAIVLGASDAKIIPVDLIPIEEEIVEMCRPPGCEDYGRSANCPPYVMTPKEAREWIRRFRMALLFKIDISPEVLISEEGLRVFKKVFIISSKLEAMSVEQGYTFSKSLSAGFCKGVFCKDVPCEALADGGECRYPSLARPPLEAIGINVFRLAKDVGWEIHAILRDSDPKDIPSAMLAGLLLVA